MKLDSVTYDNIGVGAGAKGAIREEKEKLSNKTKCPIFRGFTANAEVVSPESEYKPGKKNKDMFYNLKAQTWWLVADRFKNTYDALNGKPFDPNLLVAIDGTLKNLHKLCAELAQPRREFLNGKFRVESKKDMAKRGVVSPNLADAFVMAFAPESSFNLAALI
jgi:phage terminase large subunit